jgi:acyl-CoA reductase-like NAD-dependent aldehyde dehydrogenase
VGEEDPGQRSANLTRTQLELGGKNALIVMDDANLVKLSEPPPLQVFRTAVSGALQQAASCCTGALPNSSSKPSRSVRQDECRRRITETTDMGPVAGPDQFAIFRRRSSRQKQMDAPWLLVSSAIRRDISFARRCSRM